MVKTIILLVHGHKIETGLLITEVEEKLKNPNTEDGTVTIDSLYQQFETNKIGKGGYCRFNPKNLIALIAVA